MPTSARNQSRPASKQATADGLIERDPRAGRASYYRTLPQNWEQAVPKPLRLVIQPKRKQKTPADKHEEKPANPPKPPESSPIFRRHGFCAACNHLVEVETVSEEEIAQEQARASKEASPRPPRAGPTRAQAVVDQPLSSFKEFKRGVW